MQVTTSTKDFDALSEKIAQKKAELDVLVAEFNAKLKKEFTAATKFFFEETGIQAVIWNQYTPSFNDGEPCEFTLGDPVFITKGFDSEDLLSADEYEDDELYGTIPYSRYRDYDHPLSAACAKFADLLQSIEDVLESTYGNYGTTVYLTKDETYEAEYDCGY